MPTNSKGSESAISYLTEICSKPHNTDIKGANFCGLHPAYYSGCRQFLQNQRSTINSRITTPKADKITSSRKERVSFANVTREKNEKKNHPNTIKENNGTPMTFLKKWDDFYKEN